jgi:hypothetical protein
MALAAALFLGLCLIPPIAAHASDNRRQRRRSDWASGPGRGGYGNGGQGSGT